MEFRKVHALYALTFTIYNLPFSRFTLSALLLNPNPRF